MQTLTSGKFNEPIDLFIVEIKGLASGRRNDGRVEAEAPATTDGRRIVHRALDASEDKLTG